MGVCWDVLGEYDKALLTSLKIYGEDHPEIAIVKNNLGMLHEKRGEYIEFQGQLPISRPAFGMFATNRTILGLGRKVTQKRQKFYLINRQLTATSSR